MVQVLVYGTSFGIFILQYCSADHLGQMELILSVLRLEQTNKRNVIYHLVIQSHCQVTLWWARTWCTTFSFSHLSIASSISKVYIVPRSTWNTCNILTTFLPSWCLLPSLKWANAKQFKGYSAKIWLNRCSRDWALRQECPRQQRQNSHLSLIFPLNCCVLSLRGSLLSFQMAVSEKTGNHYVIFVASVKKCWWLHSLLFKP